MAVSVQYLASLVGGDYMGPIKWGQDCPSDHAGVYFVVNPYKTNEYKYDTTAINNWILKGKLAMPAKKIISLIGSYWHPDETILYIGQTTAAGGLRSRLYAYYGTMAGKSTPHSGGKWIKTLSNINNLDIYWIDKLPEQFTDFEKCEQFLLTAFMTCISNCDSCEEKKEGISERHLPFANREGKNQQGKRVRKKKID